MNRRSIGPIVIGLMVMVLLAFLIGIVSIWAWNPGKMRRKYFCSE